MIKKSAHTYLCNGDQHAPAFIACCADECKSYALICGSSQCDCIVPHQDHQTQSFEGILKRAKQQQPVSEEIVNTQVAINSLIDELIQKLQGLKIEHSHRIETERKEAMARQALRMKLLRNEQLQTSEATGECFSTMLRELKQEMKNPYSTDKKELEAIACEAIRTVEQIVKKINTLWSVHYTFSKTSKHDSIEVSQDQLSVRETEVTNDHNFVLIEPALSRNFPSQIEVEFSKCESAGVGVCSNNLLSNWGYFCPVLVKGEGAGIGLYIAFSHGWKVLDTEGCSSEENFKFTDGQAIKVTFDPTSGILSLETRGASPKKCKIETKFDWAKEAVYFCVTLFKKDSKAMISL